MFKQIKTIKTMCPECQMDRQVQYGTIEENVSLRGENIKVLSKIFYCPEGDHYFSNFEDEEEKIQFVYREFRKRRNILQPEEIVNIRKKYGLSQSEFCLFLGYGKKTLARYETGAIPDDSHNNFIKLVEDTDSFQTHFNNIKSRLPVKLKRKIEKRLLELQTKEIQASSIYVDETGFLWVHAFQGAVFTQAITGSIPNTLGSAAQIPLCSTAMVTGYFSYPGISWGIPVLEKKDIYNEELARAA
jgi:putative zinc finger/helix-turn-helix YgiT family protein